MITGLCKNNKNKNKTKNNILKLMIFIAPFQLWTSGVFTPHPRVQHTMVGKSGQFSKVIAGKFNHLERNFVFEIKKYIRNSGKSDYLAGKMFLDLQHTRPAGLKLMTFRPCTVPLDPKAYLEWQHIYVAVSLPYKSKYNGIFIISMCT